MNVYPLVNTSPANTFDIDITYSTQIGIGLGYTLKILLSGANTKSEGPTARWDMNDVYLDMEKDGDSVDAFYMYGYIAGNASGTITYSTGAYATLGAVYVFPNRPVENIEIKEDIAFPNKTITVKP